MQLGMIGLGRMGANLVRRLMRDGHECVVYDVSKPTRSTSSRARARPARTRSRSSWRSSSTPRAVWIMVPGRVRRRHDRGAARAPGAGRHHHRRRQLLLPRRHRPGRARSRPRGIHYVDVGTSGGVFGLERGFCLMIGGEDEVVAHLDPIFRRSRRASTAAERTPGRTGDPSTAENGYLHCGPERRRALREDGPQRDRVRDHGRVRRGPQHPAQRRTSGKQQRAGDAETTPLRDPEYYQYDLDIPAVAEVWRRGSVVASLAARPHRPRALGEPRPRRLRRPGVRLRRGALDGARRGRRRRPRRRAQRGAVRRASRRAATPTSPTRCCRRCARSSAATTRSSIRRSARPDESDRSVRRARVLRDDRATSPTRRSSPRSTRW